MAQTEEVDAFEDAIKLLYKNEPDLRLHNLQPQAIFARILRVQCVQIELSKMPTQDKIIVTIVIIDAVKRYCKLLRAKANLLLAAVQGHIVLSVIYEVFGQVFAEDAVETDDLDAIILKILIPEFPDNLENLFG